MKTIFKAFSKKLFGAKYERLKSTFFVCAVVFWGLHIADFKIEVAPAILYLMVSTLSAGVMWQNLSSEKDSADLQNLLMLPFDNRSLVFSYVAALGIHTFLTKTAVLLAVVFALSRWSLWEISESILCAVNAILVTAAVFSLKKRRYIGCLWAATIAAVLFLLWDSPYFLPLITLNCVFALLILRNADGYFLCSSGRRGKATLWHSCSLFSHTRKLCSESAKGSVSFIWRYFFRYLTAHKNYLANTAIMWCIACVMPLFLGNMESLFVLPIGFAILSINTPICILLSADPDFEQAIRMLPGQKKAFCLPYCLFIFMCNSIADTLFLFSWQLQFGGITILTAAPALFFAFLSAVLSVLLEWFFPVRGWKTESDLWRHPRKYAVPLVMLLLAGVIGTLSLR